MDKRPPREPRWVVFSDRQKNAAYAGPDSDVPLKTHGLMDAFYVIGQRGDYLHLMKYNPKVVLRKWRRRIANWKEMQEGGWVSRSQLLLSRRAFADPRSQYHTKFVTAISSQYTEVFSHPKRYFEGSEIKVYGAPDFTSTVTGKIPVSSILYAYKASVDEKFMLVGKSSQLSPDSAQVEVLGWVPQCLLYRWGQRSFWQPLEPPVTPIRGKCAPTITQALVLAAATDSAETVARIGLPDSLLNGSPLFLQTLFPHYTVVRDTLAARSALRTGILTNVFDRRRNKVYNVGGSTISYAQLLQIKKKTRHLNLVFVVDGGEGREATILQPLLSVVQTIKLKLDSMLYFKQVRYAAVIPGDRQNPCLGETQLPLTTDYVTLINFFQDKRQRSLRCPPEQTRDVFSHLKDAAELLRDAKNETNIIVVIGSTSGSTGTNMSWNSVIQKLTPVKPRLIILQARSGESEPYNNFVIDAKTIVFQLAHQVSRLKKDILINPQDIKAENLFKIETHHFQSFSLDYPKNSMWQSMVLFPNKLQKLSPVVMNQYLDTLVSQVHTDNTNIITSLETVFNSYVGNVYTHVDKRFKYHFGDYTDALPEGMVRNLYADLDFFALPALLPFTSADGSLLGNSGVFVGTDELQSLSLNFSWLGAPWQQKASLSRRQAYVQLRKSIKAYRKQKRLPINRKAKRLTLLEVTGLFTDYAPETSQWSQYTLRHLKQKKKMPVADYRLVTKIWSDYHTKLKSYYSDTEIVKYRSLNKDYYWIPYRF